MELVLEVDLSLLLDHALVVREVAGDEDVGEAEDAEDGDGNADEDRADDGKNRGKEHGFSEVLVDAELTTFVPTRQALYIRIDPIRIRVHLLYYPHATHPRTSFLSVSLLP